MAMRTASLKDHTDHLAKAVTFVSVVRAGSLAAAAKQLSVGKSTLSEQLTALEDALGARLLERTSRGLKLTQEGQVFYEGALRCLGAWEEAWAGASEQQGAATGTLRVTAPVGFEYLLAGVLQELSESHPDLRYELSFDDRPLDLVGDGYDLGLRMGAQAASSLSAKKLGECAEVFVASRALPDSVQALERAEWVCHSAFRNAYRNARRVSGEPVALPAPRVRALANTTEGRAAPGRDRAWSRLDSGVAGARARRRRAPEAGVPQLPRSSDAARRRVPFEASPCSAGRGALRGAGSSPGGLTASAALPSSATAPRVAVRWHRTPGSGS